MGVGDILFDSTHIYYSDCLIGLVVYSCGRSVVRSLTGSG